MRYLHSFSLSEDGHIWTGSQKRNLTRLRHSSSKLAALQHRASARIQNKIAEEPAQVCFALLEKSLIASGKEASSVYPCLSAYRHSLALCKYHKQLSIYPVLVPSDLFTQVIPSVERPGLLPNISSWSRCDNFILKIKNPCFPVQESKPLVRAIS